MGTKRPNSAPFDSTPNLSPADYKLQSGGKISPDPYPRTKMTGSTERERDTKQEENWRRETESEKMRDKARYREMDTVGGYCEKDRALAPQFREGERERRERRRMQEDDRGKNVRMLSNVERGAEREVKTGRIKGETFPRMGKDGTMANRRTKDEEKGEKRQRDQPQREETYQWERERQHRDRQRDETLIKGGRKEEEKNFGGRYVEDGRSRQRERHNAPGSEFQDRTREAVNLRDTRERDVARKREKPRPDMDEREARMYSPYRRTDGEIYTDMKVRENRRERRDARSEGDIDEREVMREREREETVYQHSRSEGDNWSATDREKNRDRLYYREREREVDRPRRREAEREREMYKVDRRTARQADRQGERWRERDDKRDDDRYREERRNRERKERRDDAVDRSSRSPTNSVPRIPAQVQSSKERSRDVNSETRYRRDGDRYEERDTRRERAGENERGKERWRDPERTAERRQKQLIRSERVESDRAEMTSHMPEQRRMWLEPQKGKNSKDEFVHRERHTGKKEWRSEEESSMESQGEWAREVRRVKDEPDERYLNPGNYKDRFEGRDEHREDAEGVSVDGDEESDVWRESDKEGKERWPERDVAVEGRQHRDTEGENVTNNTEETVREEEGGGHYWACSDSEGGSEAGKQDRDRIFSGEDGFVTVSSGEDDRGDEEEFKDCRETWEVGDTSEDPAPVGFKGSVGDEEGEKERTIEKEEQSDEEEKGGEKKSKYVFCVIGQTLSRSKGSDMLLSQDDQKGGAETSNSNLETHYNHSDDDTHRSQEDVHVTSDKNDHQPAIDNKNTESDAPQEDRLTLGETDDGDFRYGSSSELQHPEPAERIRTKVEPSHTEMGAMKRDSQTERLLKEWRETIQGVAGCERGPNCPVPVSPSDGVCSQDNLEQIESLLDHINTTAMSPEEVEAIKVRMNEAWSTSEVPKRHSQAPHLKWAKSVLREILGHSDEQTADEPTTEAHEDQGVNKSESRKQQEEADHETADLPVFTFTKYKQHSEPDMEDECLLEEFRGMRQNQADMHTDQVTTMHVVTPTYTHADTLINSGEKGDHVVEPTTEPSDQAQLEKTDMVSLTETQRELSREKEVEMFSSVTKTLYKPRSCPILSYDRESDLIPSREVKSQEGDDEMGQSEEEMQGEEPEEGAVGEGALVDEVELDAREGEQGTDRKTVTLKSSISFRDLGPKARLRRRGIRKTTQRRNEELIEVEEEEEEEEGVGRDRRARVFSTTDDEEDRSRSWSHADLRNVMDTIMRRKRNSKIFNAAQLYQQYSEAAQNSEILRQSRSDVLSVCGESIPSPIPSPTPSPPPARRPLPPLPPVPHPHSLSKSDSITSAKSLCLPEPPRNEGRPSSPRLSISLTNSSTLWRDLPGVRNSTELQELTEDQRRLQEVRFEVVTSEASYCRSLDIVVEYFVKSQQLKPLLTSQDRNWLFSRLADVRAISHSFLSKLEERVESDVMQFTVCDIIARQCQRFKMVYVPYLTNQSYQDATYQRLMNVNPRFKQIVEKLERSPVCQRLPLRSFLVLPFQRITRIKLLVQNIVKKTTPSTAEGTQAVKALRLLEKLIQESNESISQMQSIESLVSLSAKVDYDCKTLPLISQSRRLVREGPVTELMDFSLKENERNVYLHLFNDYLLLSLQKEGGRFTVIDHCPVSEMRVENCRVKLHSLQKNLIRLHMSNKALLLRTDTQSDKLRWISALSRPHPEIDFSAAQDFAQMQCIRAYVAQQPDELSLEKADIILVHQESSDLWVEGTRLSDRHYGWVPKSHLETINSSRVRQRNLSDALKLTTATATV
ncbi:trichohyalin isoform X1 [Cololabis saira]|uniref:trichohyalin isoform X1 n=1 Tax=Cololabis saira TaxID=129043 RepID=UPI002AD20D6E|nr:trichohyalin isoform X1 [Cololabis saira]